MGDPITPPGPGPDPAQPDEPLPMPDDDPFLTPQKPPSKEPSPDSPKIGDDRVISCRIRLKDSWLTPRQEHRRTAFE